MSGFGRQAFLLSAARLANYGLMIVSPVILVRFLTVEDFGRYREFLMYGSMLQGFASLTINDSLLYFTPKYPASSWRIVRATSVLVACNCAAVIFLLVLFDKVSGGGLVGPYLWSVSAYVIFFVNVDFWESFLLARRQTGAMFAYTAGRLIGRMLVVVAVAIATHDVNTIILALVGLEGLRLVISAIAWRYTTRESVEPPVPNLLREQLHFCVPAGIAMILTQTNRSLGNIVVVKFLGAAALAQFTIGTYGEPIVIALRNSISTALLPEMVRRNAVSTKEPLSLWQKTTVVNCMLVLPAAVLLARYAFPLVTKVFGANYQAAVPVLQIYGFAMVRSCFDFSPPLRSVGKTRPLVLSNIAAIVSNSVCLFLLLPLLGISGAMIARVVSGFFDGAYLGFAVTQIYGISARKMLPWASLAKLVSSATLAAGILIGDFWTDKFGVAGVLIASLAYGGLFTAFTLMWRIPEAETLLRKFTAAAARFGRAIRNG